MNFYQLIRQYNLPDSTQIHPESLRHPQDTFQTPSRHPTDTRKQSTFWLIRGHWEKRQQLDMTTSIQLFMIYMTSKLPQTSARHPQNDQDTHRHHPDTPQTQAFLGIRDHWKKRQYLSWQDFFTFLPTDLVSIPPQTHSDSIQTPSDTIQTPPGIGVFYAIQGTRIQTISEYHGLI